MSLEKIEYDMCSDCVIAFYNDDYSSLDFYYSKDEADQLQEMIKRRLNKEFGDENFAGLSWMDSDGGLRQCDICSRRKKVYPYEAFWRT